MSESGAILSHSFGGTGESIVCDAFQVALEGNAQFPSDSESTSDSGIFPRVLKHLDGLGRATLTMRKVSTRSQMLMPQSLLPVPVAALTRVEELCKT